MKAILLLLAPVLCFTLAPLSPATTIWDNGGPDLVSAYQSDFDSSPQQAQQYGDNFTLSTTQTATQIQWWGAYGFNNTPTAPDDFTIRFFNITAGIPATTPLFEYSVGDVGRTDTGLDIASFDLYSFTATIPDTLLGPGDYLLSIVNNTAADGDDNWFWATSNEFGGSSWFRVLDGQFWNGNDIELAFNISGPTNGAAVPSSGTSAVFLGMALVGLFAFQRKLGRTAA